jgi:hypothetical protein
VQTTQLCGSCLAHVLTPHPVRLSPPPPPPPAAATLLLLLPQDLSGTAVQGSFQVKAVCPKLGKLLADGSTAVQHVAAAAGMGPLVHPDMPLLKVGGVLEKWPLTGVMLREPSSMHTAQEVLKSWHDAAAGSRGAAAASSE